MVVLELSRLFEMWEPYLFETFLTIIKEDENTNDKRFRQHLKKAINMCAERTECDKI